MPDAVDWRGIASRVTLFLKLDSNSVLFAGAGVGQLADLPGWGDFIERLAVVADKYEAILPQVIRQRATEFRYPEAAQLFHQCDIPVAEKFKARREPFIEYNSLKLKPLVSLPFSAIVTTNYDHSLHDAWAAVHGSAPNTAELFDKSLEVAPYWTQPFIARIHGRVDVPEEMVVDTDDYRRLASDDAYGQFLFNILTRRRCLFVGFSFLDPAIDQVLKTVERYVKSGLHNEHLALVPEHASNLIARLAEVNIAVQTFKQSAAGDYSNLWGGLSQSARQFPPGRVVKPISPLFPPAFDDMRRVMAACYAHAKLQTKLQPLREIVVQGLIVSILSPYGTNGLKKQDIVSELGKLLPLTANELDEVIQEPLSSLTSDSKCYLRDGYYVCNTTDNTLEIDLELLVKGAYDRFILRRGAKTSQSGSPMSPEVVKRALTDVIQTAVLERGWDLGADFAGAAQPSPSLWTILEDIAEQRANGLTPDIRRLLVDACVDLLQRPTDNEATVLADLGRLTFGMEVVLQQGRTALLHRRLLPEVLYLDATVALPLLVEGHPLRPTYIDVTKRWRAATAASGLNPRLLIADVFLNEILSHRDRSIRIVEEGRLEDPSRLRSHIVFKGAEYANVFISAYATFVGRQGKRIKFADWLGEHAPYTTPTELAEYLKSRDIEAAIIGSLPQDDLFHNIRRTLEDGYDSDKYRYEKKPDILIRHEASQIRELWRELSVNQRSMFVTADNSLRRTTTSPALNYVGAAIVSPVAVIELIDLIIGVRPDARSFTRLLWGVRHVDDKSALRSYLVDLALQRYDEAMIMSLPLVVEAIVAEAAADAGRQALPLTSESPDDEARTADFLDRVANDFFEEMTKAAVKFRDQVEDKSK